MAILTMALLTMKVDLISLSVGGPDYRDAPFVAKVRELAAAWLGLEG